MRTRVEEAKKKRKRTFSKCSSLKRARENNTNEGVVIECVCVESSYSLISAETPHTRATERANCVNQKVCAQHHRTPPDKFKLFKRTDSFTEAKNTHTRTQTCARAHLFAIVHTNKRTLVDYYYLTTCIN